MKPWGYLLLLSILSMVLALLTLGLVHSWGHQVPRWVPGIGGRRIPARPVAAIAMAGGAALIAICLYYLLNAEFHFVEQGWSPSPLQSTTWHEQPGWSVLRYYAPLLAWGPLVLIVAADYRRRAKS